ncbi:MAG: signal peptidase II [Candidatus Omnitrophota bacterium]|nr:signal peptidase II [Candidatus Omnitrophota bacterium]MBU1928628.1 signal peptidase II [Candidatus Omnitrophota bacterium]MBU2034754.1 signal peptidase II [Candidatus Omnitrophota bacterium]MBU2221825.1 signal peptidase II [Candidatus Omnitrophota bacterium]MBU2258476.1 signal peptidase II [Candidatus Omnitrophota bacterium]
MIQIIVISIFLIDRLSKYLIISNLLPGQSLPLLKNIFHLTLVQNKGAAFGVLRNQVPFFIFITILAIILIFCNLRNNLSRPVKICLGLILAGALGNLMDRVFFGYVIDFIDFRIWPVFNIADSAITIGAIFLVYTIFKKPQSTIHHPSF